tara:strand:- start:15761 stop:23251 length:7491 start_codon:yes stop_codon:yes gene_type:complete
MRTIAGTGSGAGGGRDLLFWLSSYYDDFNGARAIADDLNIANATTNDHTKTHDGSYMNRLGSALNPRYAWCFSERAQANDIHFAEPSTTAINSVVADFWSGELNHLQHNLGIHEWFTLNPARIVDNSIGDDILGRFYPSRGLSGGLEGRSFLQYPISCMANRQDFNGARSLRGYLAFFNGHDTGGTYYCPTGDGSDEIDFTYGGSVMTRYDAQSTISGQSYFYPSAGAPLYFGDNLANTRKTTLFTSFASVYVAEQKNYEYRDREYAIGHTHPLKSVSGMPFFINQLFTEDTGTYRILTYDGPLRMKGIGDIFTIRMAVHKISNFTLNKYVLELGYLNTDTFNKTTQDFANGSMIKLEFTPTDIPATDDFTTWSGAIPNPIVNDDLWVDINIVPDFTTNTWEAYVDNHTARFANGSFLSRPGGGTWSPTELYGWSLEANVSAFGSDGFASLTTLIDRAAIYLPLYDEPQNLTAAVRGAEVLSMDITMGADSISSCTLEIADDDNKYNLLSTVVGDTFTEWRLLVFRDNEHRPIWSGIIESITHRQNTKSQSVNTIIQALDSLSILDKTIVNWESGQNAQETIQEHASLGNVVSQRYSDVMNLQERMFFGVAALKQTKSTLGFESDTGYVPLDHQRTVLHSGHPMQLYMNEDHDGPNNVEQEYDGGGANSTTSTKGTFSLMDIVACYPGGPRAHPSSGSNVNTLDVIVAWNDDLNLPTNPPAAGAEGTTYTTWGNLTQADHVRIIGTQHYDEADGWRIRMFSTIYPSVRGGGNQTKYSDKYFIKMSLYKKDAVDTSVAVTENDLKGHGAGANRIETVKFLGTSIDTGNIRLKVTMDNTHTFPFGAFLQSSYRWKTEDATAASFMQGVVTTYRGSGAKDWFIFELDTDYWPHAVGTTTTLSSSEDEYFIDIRDCGHSTTAQYDRPSEVRPIIMEESVAGKTILTNPDLFKVKGRNTHARALRDLPLSPFFQAQFGVIHENPYHSHGYESALNHTLSPAQATAFSLAGYANTYSASSNLLSSSATSIIFEEPGVWYHAEKNEIKYPIIDLIDIDTNQHEYIIGNAVTLANSPIALRFEKSGTYGVFIYVTSGRSADPLALWDTVVHEGFEQDILNGVHQVVTIAIVGANTTYQTRRVDKHIQGKGRSIVNSGTHATDSKWWKDPDGLDIESRDKVDFLTLAPNDETSMLLSQQIYGGCTVAGIKGQTRDWVKNKTVYRLRRVDESNGYKHCWALFADMRVGFSMYGDNHADADGGYRKTNFGLSIPTSQNYDLSIVFADQTDIDGNLDKYADLKLGADCDVWSLDTTVEPYTAASWSALGSDNEPLDTLLLAGDFNQKRYKDWPQSLGAVCLIDTSRFWNLNSMGNRGRPGYVSGGNLDFGDYTTAHWGYPMLVDNYYSNAAADHKNTDTLIANHTNKDNWTNDSTILLADVATNATTLTVYNIDAFSSSGGYGVIVGEKGTGRNAEKQVFAMRWGGVNRNAGTLVDTLTSVYIKQYEIMDTPSDIRASLIADSSSYGNGSQSQIKIQDADGTVADGFDTIRVYNTPAAIHALRLMMCLEGYVETPNIGTYWTSDKMRALYSLASLDSWPERGQFPCISDINNVPITKDMTSTGIAYNANYNGVGKGDTDSYGFANNAKGQPVSATVQEAATRIGIGYYYDTTNTFSWMMGADNRLEVRPLYNSGFTFTRNNLKTSTLSSQASSQITNVRVYYAGNNSYADYPAPASGAVTRWKTLDMPQTLMRKEAEAVAKAEYEKERISQLSVTAEVLRLTDETNVMLSDARYGYIADVCRKTLPNNTAVVGAEATLNWGEAGAAWWTSVWGGSPFAGMCNALDGRLAFSAPGTVLGKEVAAHRDPASNSYDDFADDVKLGLMANETVVTADVGHIEVDYISAGSKNARFKRLAAGTPGAWVAIQTGGWFTLPDATGSAPYATVDAYFNNAGIVADGNIYTKALSDLNSQSFYYWYGLNSISHAVQVVHVDKGTNKLSATSDNELRVAVTIEDAAAGPFTDPNDAVFRIWLLDYSFSEGVGTLPSTAAHNAPTYAPTLRGNTSIIVRGSGYYTLAVPSSYDTDTPNIILSFDAEYCKAVLRMRNHPKAGRDGGGTYEIENANNLDGLTTYSNLCQYSPFPLGMRKYTEMGGYANTRAAYNAPRIHIVDDLNYRPATKCTYTDTHIDLSAEEMVIKSISWSQRGRQHEKVQLSLEKKQNHYKYGFAKMFRPKPGGGGWSAGGIYPAPASRPPTIGPTTPEPGLGGYGLSSAEPSYSNKTKGVGDGDASSAWGGVSSQQFSDSTWNTIKGRTNIDSDNTGSTGTWGVLGQKKVGKPSSGNNSLQGIEDISAPSLGHALQGLGGVVLPGITDPEVGAQGEVHEHTIEVKVPSDVSAGLIGVEAVVSVANIASGGNVVLTTTIECSETGSSSKIATTIANDTSRSLITLFPMQMLDGAQTAGNTLKLTFSRSVGSGSDNALYQSLQIHSIQFKARRYNAPTEAQSHTFNPY